MVVYQKEWKEPADMFLEHLYLGLLVLALHDE
jgi:hypothetical protein